MKTIEKKPPHNVSEEAEVADLALVRALRDEPQTLPQQPTLEQAIPCVTEQKSKVASVPAGVVRYDYADVKYESPVEGTTICPGCGWEIDPNICHCGDCMNAHDIYCGHTPVSMGCTCCYTDAAKRKNHAYFAKKSSDAPSQVQITANLDNASS